jgi:hypothetical protein
MATARCPPPPDGAAHDDAERDADDQLDGALAAQHLARGQADGCRDRGEERLRVADHVTGEVPGDPGRHCGLRDGAQSAAQAEQPGRARCP